MLFTFLNGKPTYQIKILLVCNLHYNIIYVYMLDSVVQWG